MRAFLATLGAIAAAGSLFVLASVAFSAADPASHAVPGTPAGDPRSTGEIQTIGSGPQFLTPLEIEKSSEKEVAVARALEAERTAAALRAAVALRTRFPGRTWLPEWMRGKPAPQSRLAPMPNPNLQPVHPLDQGKLDETLKHVSRAPQPAKVESIARVRKERR
jgi:hypothetical protein